MTKPKRPAGRPALGADKRTVKVAPHFTEAEAARMDAVRGGVERSTLVREGALAMVKRLEASERAREARDALVMP